MMFSLQYHTQVVQNDIPLLPKKERAHIQNAIQEKLTTKPEVFGKPLRRSLKGYRRLRVGDYRVVFRIEQSSVKIFAIGDRSTIYENYKNRLI